MTTACPGARPDPKEKGRSRGIGDARGSTSLTVDYSRRRPVTDSQRTLRPCLVNPRGVIIVNTSVLLTVTMAYGLLGSVEEYAIVILFQS
jgi:hypothetical protein